MKKIILASMLALCSLNAAAKGNLQQQKLQIVRSIYADGGNHWVMLRNSTQDFLILFSEIDRNRRTDAVGCGQEYDLVSQGQDSNYAEIKRTIKIIPDNNGNVRVSFKNSGINAKLTYVMKCSNGKCLIDDVLEKGVSYKRSIRQCLREGGVV